MVEIPTPIPPINLKKENRNGSKAKADPTADKKYKNPTIINVFFLP